MKIHIFPLASNYLILFLERLAIKIIKGKHLAEKPFLGIYWSQIKRAPWFLHVADYTLQACHSNTNFLTFNRNVMKKAMVLLLLEILWSLLPTSILCWGVHLFCSPRTPVSSKLPCQLISHSVLFDETELTSARGFYYEIILVILVLRGQFLVYLRKQSLYFMFFKWLPLIFFLAIILVFQNN